MVTTAFRLCSQLEEIRVTTSIVHKVSRFRDQFFGDITIFAQGKNVPTLSILLALASAGRSSDLRALNVRYKSV